jgi:hypothetical protein
MFEDEDGNKYLTAIEAGKGTTIAGLRNDLLATLPTGYSYQILNKEGVVAALSASVTTGTVIRILGPANEVIDEITVVIKGDVTGTGTITFADARLVLEHSFSPVLTGVQILAASVTTGGWFANAREILGMSI